jgi:hypothetical protein
MTKAIELKHDFLKNNYTWIFTILPTNRQTTTRKWILKIKYTLFSDVHRYKVKLNAKAFNQILGVDYVTLFPQLLK